MGKMSRMGLLRIADHDTWVAKIFTAMKNAKGHIDVAAATLDVSGRTLARWLQEPEFRKVTRAASGIYINEEARGNR